MKRCWFGKCNVARRGRKVRIWRVEKNDDVRRQEGRRQEADVVIVGSLLSFVVHRIETTGEQSKMT